ncbi:MAG TPA: cytochrome C biogenesis protein, partial [Puia sp.]|nr:cytochrome C biogenesis protein [Puia sp.]
MHKKSGLLFILFIFLFFKGNSQDSTAITWEAGSSKSAGGEYQLIFKANVKPGWELYAPNQDLSGTPSVELYFADSSFSTRSAFVTEGKSEKRSISLFDNASFNLYPGNAKFSAPIVIKGVVPARVFGTLNYFYGKEDSFYSGS